MIKVEIDTYLKVTSFKCPFCTLLVSFNTNMELSPLHCPFCKVRIVPPISELIDARLVRVAYHKKALTEGVKYGSPPKS